ncbi:hypothetical protein TWF718_006664 [Orbilia javanica]|uniref:Uncharacterized protein n=1 Tax=Orbilia javanica TaxID=47235 RepID=A0AAN8MNB8_9PEZI
MPRPSPSSKSSDPPPPEYPLPFLTDPDAASKPTPPTTSLPYRLNLHPISRLTIANIFAFAAVFIPTTIRTAHISSLIYRAENAHRLPEKRADWYQYHRAKNHYAASKGLAEGFRRAGGICGEITVTDEGADGEEGALVWIYIRGCAGCYACDEGGEGILDRSVCEQREGDSDEGEGGQKWC